MVAPIFMVVEPQGALVRTGFGMDSKPVGKLKNGEKVKALLQKKTPAGITRIRIGGKLAGWVSLTAANGTVLLKAVSNGTDTESEGDSSDAVSSTGGESTTDGETTDGSESEDEAAASKQPLLAKISIPAGRKPQQTVTQGHTSATSPYQVLKPTLVRAGFAMGSKQIGQLKPGETVKVIERRRNAAAGVVRVRFEGRVNGWASMTSKNGDQLFKAKVQAAGKPSAARAKKPPAAAAAATSAAAKAEETESESEDDSSDAESSTGGESTTDGETTDGSESDSQDEGKQKPVAPKAATASPAPMAAEAASHPTISPPLMNPFLGTSTEKLEKYAATGTIDEPGSFLAFSRPFRYLSPLLIH